MTAPTDFDSRLRREAMAWLTVRTNDGADSISSEELREFAIDGRRFLLMDRQRGIRQAPRTRARATGGSTAARSGHSPRARRTRRPATASGRRRGQAAGQPDDPRPQFVHRQRVVGSVGRHQAQRWVKPGIRGAIPCGIRRFSGVHVSAPAPGSDSCRAISTRLDYAVDLVAFPHPACRDTPEIAFS